MMRHVRPKGRRTNVADDLCEDIAWLSTTTQKYGLHTFLVKLKPSDFSAVQVKDDATL